MSSGARLTSHSQRLRCGASSPSIAVDGALSATCITNHLPEDITALSARHRSSLGTSPGLIGERPEAPLGQLPISQVERL